MALNSTSQAFPVTPDLKNPGDYKTRYVVDSHKNDEGDRLSKKGEPYSHYYLLPSRQCIIKLYNTVLTVRVVLDTFKSINRVNSCYSYNTANSCVSGGRNFRECDYILAVTIPHNS
jgi:hypothetical protein